MAESIYQNDSYDEKIRKQAPFTIEIKEREIKAIVGALYVAKRTIDNMDPFEREVHNFDQHDIRDIESQVRGKLNELDTSQNWIELTLTAKEVIAIQQGLTDMRFNDNMTNNCKRLDNLLSWHTNPHND